mgnify:CR=1 FL=1
MQPLELRGRVASPGLALGPLVSLAPSGDAPSRRTAGSSAEEAAALQAAVARAIADIGALIAGEQGAAAEMLEFQVAMLSDDALSAPALAAIATGRPADSAWSEALDAEIAGYTSSGDDYFRARASDLRDLRDRVLMSLRPETAADAIPAGSILWAEDLAPTRFLEHDWSQGGGIALSAGSASSHVAMLARARGIPMLVGVAPAGLVGEDCVALLDAEGGRLTLSPGPDAVADYEAAQARASQRASAELAVMQGPAVTRDGTPVEVLINVATPSDVDGLEPSCCDGIGLMRSELLFRDGAPLPGEEEQLSAYRRIIHWAAGRPVTVRTLDIGGDKPIAGLTPKGEANPFLGQRGIRLLLAHQDVLKVQLRALARAAALGPLKVMLPMVTLPEELAAAAALLSAAVEEAKVAGHAAARPPLGIMVEVPAVAIAPEAFPDAAFFSIGSNDLTQYVMAAARDLGSVDHLYRPDHPAVLALIHNTVRAATRMGMPVSVCGDMAGDERYIAALLAIGVRSLSVAPGLLGRVKTTIRSVDLGEAAHGTA